MRALVAGLPDAVLRRWHGEWSGWAHDGQVEPPACAGAGAGDWRIWVMLGGRGFGKTRGGAEWVRAQSLARPGISIALVAASIDEARAVMVEGRSGLLRIARAGDGVRFERSRRRLVWANGSEATLYSGARAEGLRGPEHHLAWCDELAKWTQARAAWDNLLLGLRLGERPRVLVTTTPKPGTVLTRILAEPGVVMTGGPSAANPHLPPAFLAAMTATIGGSRLARQELGGELIEDVEGALWPRELLDFARSNRPANLRRVVIGVDPPASAAGTCGIVACALGADGIGYVLDDRSAGGLSPEGWARAVARAAEAWGADRVVAEANQGGDMVRAVLRSAEVSLPVKLVHAARGKSARAEPVAALFESGRAKFAGAFPALEDQLAGMTASGFAGGSPDRADAMVWALTELMLGRQVAPSVRLMA